MKILPSAQYFTGLSTAARMRVASSLAATTSGREVDLVTPIIPDGVPDLWREKYRNELLPRVTNSGYSGIDQFEVEQAEKIGAYSIMAPYADRRESVNVYFSQNVPSVNSAALRRAVELVSSNHPLHSLRPLSLESVLKVMPKGTNLGAPFFTNDEELIPDVLERSRSAMRDRFRSREWSEDPCMLYWRGQPKGIGLPSKNRVVWGYPHWITLLEIAFQRPFQNALLHLPQHAAWVSLDQVDYVMTGLLDRAQHEILSVDFSSFDASVPRLFIDIAFEMVRRAFVHESHYIINFIQDRFLHIPIWTPDGIVTGRDGGVPSGSGFTNLIDTLVQELWWTYYSVLTGNRIKDACYQGDDGVVSFTGVWNLDNVIDAAATIGLTVNADKGGVSRSSLKFLQNIHLVDYRPDGLCRHVRPCMRALNGMMSYERFMGREWNGYMDSLRWYQQVENCKWHPRFASLVKFLYEQDEYSRKYSVDVIVKRAGGLETAESVMKQSQFVYGKEPLSGLRVFKTIQMIEDLSRGYPTVKLKVASA